MVDLCGENKEGWNSNLIYALCNSETTEVILSISWQRNNEEDKLLWMGKNAGNFTVKECYELAHQHRFFNSTNFVWKKLWRIHLHERLKILLWRILSNVMPIKLLISTHLRGGDRCCVLCGSKEESTMHLFRDCQAVRALAFGSAWGCKFDVWKNLSIPELVALCLGDERQRFCLAWNNECSLIFLACLFNLVWSMRNGTIYEGKFNMAGTLFIFNHSVRKF